MLVKSHGFTVIEYLKVREMSRTVQVREMLECKAPWYGSRLVVVDPSRTSQHAGRLTPIATSAVPASTIEAKPRTLTSMPPKTSYS